MVIVSSGVRGLMQWTPRINLLQSISQHAARSSVTVNAVTIGRHTNFNPLHPEVTQSWQFAISKIIVTLSSVHQEIFSFAKDISDNISSNHGLL